MRPLAIALAVSGAVMVALTYAVGLGWRWVLALWNPATVNSWMDPATGIGGTVARLVNLVGLGEHYTTIVHLSRDVGLLLAAVVALHLLLHSDGGVRSLRAIGLTLLAVVAFGPTVQPWYLAWGIVLLAAVAEARSRALIIWLSAVMSFLGLPGGKMLLAHLEGERPLELAAAVVALLAVVAVTYAPRLRQLALERRDRARLSVALAEPTGVPRGGS